jgi:hypothetical protein
MSAVKEVEWVGCLEPVSEERVREVEKRLGVKLPPAFIACVLQCHGGCPKRECFPYVDPETGAMVLDSLATLYSFRDPLDRETQLRLAGAPAESREFVTDRTDSILDNVVDPMEFLESGLIPFADTGSGDLICFDYRQPMRSSEPAVVLWRHEFIEDGPVVPVARNFKEFIDNLQYDEEEDAGN